MPRSPSSPPRPGESSTERFRRRRREYQRERRSQLQSASPDSPSTTTDNVDATPTATVILQGHATQQALPTLAARSGNLPKAVVVQFNELGNEVQPFLENVPRSVAVPTSRCEWKNPRSHNSIFIREQFPLMLSWAFTIHKSQGKTLDKAVVDIGKGEKCCGMTLVALSRVRQLQHILLKSFSFERLNKINRNPKLQQIQEALQNFANKAENTKITYGHLRNNA